MGKTIIVTAFITKVNNGNGRNDKTYIDYGKKMLNINIPQITFIEKHIFQEYLSEYNQKNETSENKEPLFFEYIVEGEKILFEYIIYKNKTFIFFSKEDNYLYHYKNIITELKIITKNSTKDTLEYMFTQCHKTEWVKMAILFMKQQNININICEFLWVDYGIYHMIRNDREFEYQLFLLHQRISLQLHDNIRIASCWNLQEHFNKNIYSHIAWFFAGSIFGGTASKLIYFADLMKYKCIDIITKRKSIMWEVNIWYLIYLENPNIFNSYICDHNISIISNY